MPAGDDMKSSSRLRIKPMIDASPLVSAKKTADPDDYKTSEYTLKDMYVRMVGANSPGKLASFTACKMILDEIDKYKEHLGKEGSVIGLAMQRTKLFWNRFIFKISTPTTKAGYIYREFLRGDQRRWFCPCPYCGHKQYLIFKQIKFDSKLEPIEAGKTAYYECVECSGHIQDDHKQDMINAGVWRPTAKAKVTGLRSYHAPGLLSPSDQCTFSALATKFLTVKGDRADLQDFINSDLGEIWEERPVDKFEKSQIYKIRDRNKYDRGTIPTSEPVVVILVADVQLHHIVWAVWAINADDTWLVDHGTCSVLEDLVEIGDGPYDDLNGNSYSCHREVIDSGYRTTEVYKYCIRYKRAIPIKGDTGRTTKQTAPIRRQNLEKLPDGKKIKSGHTLYHIHPTYFKDELQNTMYPRLEDDDGNPVDWTIQTPRLHFHSDIDDQFASEMVGEVPMEDRPDKFGVKKRFWKRIGPNHYFDLAQYIMAVRWIMRRQLTATAQRAKRDKEKEKDGKKPEKKPEHPIEGSREKPPTQSRRDPGVSYPDEFEDDKWVN